MDNHSHHSSHSHSSHSHSSAQKQQSRKIMRICILGIFFLSILVMIPYIAHKLFPFITSILAYHKINVSSICYTLLRFCMLLLPLFLIAPAFLYREHIEKPNLIGKLLSVTSFLFFFGMIADIFSYNILNNYVDTGDDPIMLKLLWNNIDLPGVIFCFIQGALYLILSKSLRGHKKNIVILFAVTFLAGIIMPISYMAIKGTLFTGYWDTWFSKNIYFYISQLLMLIGLILAASSRYMWSLIFWN